MPRAQRSSPATSAVSPQARSTPGCGSMPDAQRAALGDRRGQPDAVGVSSCHALELGSVERFEAADQAGPP